MKKTITYLSIAISTLLIAQDEKNANLGTFATAPDFTITTTDGVQRNLYQTLGQGNAVVLDFFFPTCSYCIQYAPVIEQAYINKGKGNGNIKFWGIDDRANNTTVNNYKQQHNVSNPCASGTQGGGKAATDLYTQSFQFSGWPTYAVICPDKTLHWDVNYPPTANGFDSYFNTCGTTAVQSFDLENNIRGNYPNPAYSFTNILLKNPVNQNASIVVFDILGNIVKQVEYDDINDTKVQISVNELKNGVYFVQLICDGTVKGITKVTVVH